MKTPDELRASWDPNLKVTAQRNKNRPIIIVETHLYNARELTTDETRDLIEALESAIKFVEAPEVLQARVKLANILDFFNLPVGSIITDEKGITHQKQQMTTDPHESIWSSNTGMCNTQRLIDSLYDHYIVKLGEPKNEED